MARFTLLFAAWRKYTEGNWVSLELAQRSEMQRVRKTFLLSHEVQNEPPCFLNCLWSLGLARSNLSPWLGQQFMSKGREEIHRVRKNLLLSHNIQNWPPCFLNSFSERSLGPAGSRLSLRLGQWFMPKSRHTRNRVRNTEVIMVNIEWPCGLVMIH